ncbi:MAG: hypothetical protein KAI44_06115 [Methylococcales bacterium]|nr:hypothetical protein [Methylococcales bacterium]
MKKIFLVCISIFLLPACADKENYEAAVLAEMQAEQDVKDYNIDPEEMAECVVDVSSKKMPGLFPYDPDRLTAYQHYTKMLSMRTTKNKKEMLEELRSTFGSPKELAEAHNNFTDSMLNCISVFIQRATEKEETEETEES